jgi:hypothetical protein
LGAGQRVAGGAFGVDRVGFAAPAARWALRAVKLDDDLPGGGEVAGQPGAVPAGAFDRERAHPAVARGGFDQFVVALWIRGHRERLHPRSGRSDQYRRGVGVGMGVDSDDDLDQLCQHGHAFS